MQVVPGMAAAVFPGTSRSAASTTTPCSVAASRREPRSHALDAMEEAYAAAGVDRFAAWVDAESDHALRHALELRGYRLDETTRAMGIVLDGARLPRPQLEVARADWREHLASRGAPSVPSWRTSTPLHTASRSARVQGESLATAIALDFDGDCGIYNVSTLERARRRGLATAVTAALLRDALARGCTTASLQATPMAERLYAALGFRDLGRILEYVPRSRPSASKRLRRRSAPAQPPTVQRGPSNQPRREHEEHRRLGRHRDRRRSTCRHCNRVAHRRAWGERREETDHERLLSRPLDRLLRLRPDQAPARQQARPDLDRDERRRGQHNIVDTVPGQATTRRCGR